MLTAEIDANRICARSKKGRLETNLSYQQSIFMSSSTGWKTRIVHWWVYQSSQIIIMLNVIPISREKEFGFHPLFDRMLMRIHQL